MSGIASKPLQTIEILKNKAFPIIVSAPGKIILHGEHSVVYNKLAIAASLGLRTKVLLNENYSNNLISLGFRALNLFYTQDFEEIRLFLNEPLPILLSELDYNLEDPAKIDHEALLQSVENFLEKSTHPDYHKSHKSALSAFFYIFKGILSSVNPKFLLRPQIFEIETDLSVGAGTGSSASFNVSLAASILLYIKIKAYEMNYLNNISREGLKPFQFESDNFCIFNEIELKLISDWAFSAEKIIHGTPSGVDNTICTYGSLVAFRKCATLELIQLHTPLRALLINTKIPRDTRVLVENVAKLKQRHLAIVDDILNAMDKVAESALNHFKNFNIECSDLVEDFVALGELADINHHLLCCLGVSHPKLNEICSILANHGFRGKLTGAGGGGYAICLVPPYITPEIIADTTKKLKERGFEAVIADLGGEGIRINRIYNYIL